MCNGINPELLAENALIINHPETQVKQFTQKSTLPALEKQAQRRAGKIERFP
jgi:hypothetical protein